jgi:arylsulfatase A-like enzyme
MDKKPNIIFIMTDDLGWKDLSSYGSTFYETPNLDRLAGEGMLFTDAYAACPVCSPTRASFMTGKYPVRMGTTDWFGARQWRGKLISAPYVNYLNTDEYNIAKAFKDNGYNTWHIGKWHLGSEERYWPQNQGFDVNIGGCGMGHPYKGHFSPWGIPYLDNGNDGDYLADKLTDEAVNLINNRGEKPFFMYLAHYAVHTPIQAKEDDINYFKDKAKRLKLDQIDPIVPGEYGSYGEMKDKRIQRRVVQSDPVYAAMIRNLDDNTGKLIESLKENGIYDETVIMFTSDNGGLSVADVTPTSNVPLSEGKGYVYDGGIRVPLIVRYPGKGKTGVCGVPVTTPDYYPTLLGITGIVPSPSHITDGVSIVPLLTGEGDIDREAIYWHYPHYCPQGGHPACGVRSGDYKLIYFFGEKRGELYNIRNDISEVYDISAERPEIKKRLEGLLNDWLADTGALIPEENHDWVCG